jgi:hypothetical protein
MSYAVVVYTCCSSLQDVMVLELIVALHNFIRQRPIVSHGTWYRHQVPRYTYSTPFTSAYSLYVVFEFLHTLFPCSFSVVEREGFTSYGQHKNKIDEMWSTMAEVINHHSTRSQMTAWSS